MRDLRIIKPYMVHHKMDCNVKINTNMLNKKHIDGFVTKMYTRNRMT